MLLLQLCIPMLFSCYLPDRMPHLEQQLQPKLNVARVAGGGDPAEGWGAEEVVRQIKVRVVEEVEGFGPEL
jgi:hypothetical protein